MLRLCGIIVAIYLIRRCRKKEEIFVSLIRIYTDGGCRGNQSDENVGGWGAVLEYGDYRKELHGGMLNTTNNRMEMTALLEALNALKKEGLTIQVFSDSSYLMNCFREKWYENWQRNGWKTAGKKPVENKELWQQLIAHLARHESFSFYRVRGHVNLNSKAADFDKLYETFLEWNGTGFSFDDFKYVTEMNNRADALANMGMDEVAVEANADAGEDEVSADAGEDEDGAFAYADENRILSFFESIDKYGL